MFECQAALQNVTQLYCSLNHVESYPRRACCVALPIYRSFIALCVGAELFAVLYTGMAQGRYPVPCPVLCPVSFFLSCPLLFPMNCPVLQTLILIYDRLKSVF